MKKLVVFSSLALLIVLGIMLVNYSRHITGDTLLAQTSAPWQPQRLQIPALGIDAAVISVGQTASGAMDAPVSSAYNSPYWTSVFWYNLGAAPGQAGNMVIAGHVDRVGGDPAVFWGLGSLKAGDTITITTFGGDTYHYLVEQQVSYPANYPGQEAVNAVFGTTSAHQLNLITCSGVWTGNGYDKRLVVIATQVG